MEKRTEDSFDYHDFLYRVTKEFMELTDEPAFVTDKLNYNSRLSRSDASAWEESDESLHKQVLWAAPFIYKHDIAHGVIEFSRPMFVVKYGHEVYWRTIPKRHIDEARRVAKAIKRYAKIKATPIRQPVAVKRFTKSIESYINRCFIKMKEKVEKNIIGPLAGRDEMTLSFDASTEHLLETVKSVVNEKWTIEVVSEHYPWVVSKEQQDFGFTERGNALMVHARIGDEIRLFQVPDFLTEEARDWAATKSKLALSPTISLEKNVELLGHKNVQPQI